MSGSVCGSDLDRSTPTGRDYSAGEGSLRQPLGEERRDTFVAIAPDQAQQSGPGTSGAVLAFHAGMHRVKRLFLLVVVPMLIAPVESGCLGSCNCPSSGYVSFSFPAELNVQLAATGEACRYAAHCDQSGDGGSCTQYDVPLTNTGSCHLTATAADGREISADLTAVAQDLGCCGTRYVVDSTTQVSLTFSQDASTDTGG